LWLTPLGIQETEFIKNIKIRNKVPSKNSVAKDLYFRNSDRIIHIQRSFPQRETLLGISVITFNDQFKPVQRLHASSAVYQQAGVWHLDKVKIWEFSPENKTLSGYKEHAEWPLDLKKEPGELSQLWNTPEEMTQNELIKVIDSRQADGYNTQGFKLESHLRFSRAFIPIIMILLGMPFALQRGRKASFASGIVISLTIFIIYFILYAIFAALGGAAILSPAVAAWSANILMALTGTWMFLKAQG
jgi:lipopolysaccharide export system permease protein